MEMTGCRHVFLFLFPLEVGGVLSGSGFKNTIPSQVLYTEEPVEFANHDVLFWLSIELIGLAMKSF
jgi:hypothetical protein